MNRALSQFGAGDQRNNTLQSNDGFLSSAIEGAPPVPRRSVYSSVDGASASAPYAQIQDVGAQSGASENGRQSSRGGGGGGWQLSFIPGVTSLEPATGAAPSESPDHTSAKTAMAPGKEFNSWQLDPGSLAQIAEIGRGNFGAVYKGQYRDPSGAAIPVALKTLHAQQGLDDKSNPDLLEPRRLFIFEASILMEFRHPNIMWLIGVCTEKVPWYMVTEFLEYGDLKAVLLNLSSKQVTLRSDEQIHVCQCIAAGMLYLASKQFVHRDLACRNCLVAGDSVVKIADFGMSRMVAKDKEACYQASFADDVPLRWMALETMTNMKFTLRSDVWSYAVTLWEIFTYGAKPYGRMNDLILSVKVADGYRPDTNANGSQQAPAGCPADLYTVMKSCWTKNPHDRPNFYEITSTLNLLQSRVELPGTSVRDIGMLSNGGTMISPYAGLTTDAKADSSVTNYESPVSVYDTTTYCVGGCGLALGGDTADAMFMRLPTTGPGAPVKEVSDTYEALDSDRKLYGDGLGNRSNVPGLVSGATYYHGVCSRPIAERALLSQGIRSELDGTYLVRQSPRAEGQMVVSMVYEGIVWHYKMHHIGNGRYQYYGKDFNDIQHIINHHMHNPEQMLCKLTRECSRF